MINPYSGIPFHASRTTSEPVVVEVQKISEPLISPATETVVDLTPVIVEEVKEVIQLETKVEEVLPIEAVVEEVQPIEEVSPVVSEIEASSIKVEEVSVNKKKKK